MIDDAMGGLEHAPPGCSEITSVLPKMVLESPTCSYLLTAASEAT